MGFPKEVRDGTAMLPKLSRESWKNSAALPDASTWQILVLFAVINVILCPAAAASRPGQCEIGEITCSSLVGSSELTSAALTKSEASQTDPTSRLSWELDDRRPDGEKKPESIPEVCIQVEWVCDGHSDCPDEEDESFCAESEPLATDIALAHPGGLTSTTSENPEHLRSSTRKSTTPKPMDATKSPPSLKKITSWSEARTLPAATPRPPPITTAAAVSMTVDPEKKFFIPEEPPTTRIPYLWPTFGRAGLNQNSWTVPNLRLAATLEPPIVSYDEYKKTTQDRVKTTSMTHLVQETTPKLSYSTRETPTPPFSRDRTSKWGFGEVTTSMTPTTTSHFWWESVRRNDPKVSLPPWMERLRTTTTTPRPNPETTPTTDHQTAVERETTTSWLDTFRKQWKSKTTTAGKKADMKPTELSEPIAAEPEMSSTKADASKSAVTPASLTPPATADSSKEIISLQVTTSTPDSSDLKQELDSKVKLKDRLESESIPDTDTYRISRLEAVAQVILPRTCSDIYSTWPAAKSGRFVIDPDGAGFGVPPFHVRCDFGHGTEPVTEIQHSLGPDTPVAHCEEPDCVETIAIEYQATEDQMDALRSASRSCSQDVKYSCRSAPLRKNAWWIGSSGKKMLHWSGSGAPESTTVCSCGLNINCVAQPPDVSSEEDADSPTGDHMCNCDANLPELHHDHGTITDAESLPIKELHFKGLKTEQEANFTLGPFKCSGARAVDNPAESCRSLRQAGHMKSGLYLLQSSSRDFLEVARCDMDVDVSAQDIGEKKFNVRIPGEPVIFDAYRTSALDSRGSSSAQVITYENFTASVGGGMSLSTGIFTAPSSGIYMFSFAGLDYSTTKAATVQLRKNGEVMMVGYSYPAGDRGTFGFQTFLTLVKGERVDTTLSGQLFSNSNKLVHFSGMLVHPGPLD